MGWAIKRPDGTYRAWNSQTQDDTLLPGEIWERLDAPPLITVPSAPPNPLLAKIDAAVASTDIPLVLKALLVAWKARL